MNLVTGGSGFIGSNFIKAAISKKSWSLVNFDALTYAGNPENLAAFDQDQNYVFRHGSICDRDMLDAVVFDAKPNYVVNFAAESHVDRSISDAGVFLQTNIFGTYTLLESALAYWRGLSSTKQKAFRYLHISTDEVYGSLTADAPGFTENSSFAPNSPYSASKASSDHLVRAYFHTYGLPVLTINCSNNYGPFQFPEKLIPLSIVKALQGETLPIYGDGQQIRDWLFVDDHCDAIFDTLEFGKIGETYNVGGNSERTNLQVVNLICQLLDELRPKKAGSFKEQIRFVQDRPGHDRRYSVDTNKIFKELSWKPKVSFNEGLRKTVIWYLSHPEWLEHVVSGEYLDWEEKHYGNQ